MRLASARVQSFRCLEDLAIDFDDATVLIGANGSGKSSALRAIEWFFNGGPLGDDDVWRHEDATVTVTVSFADLTPADRDALGSYAGGETLTLWRTWSAADGEKLTGRGLAYPPFEPVRALEGARDLRAAYGDLRDAHPELDLPAVRSADAARDAMAAWEADHPDELAPSTYSATHLFGAVGQPKLLGRFDYVFVPAVSDAHEEMQPGRGTLLARLLERWPADQDRIGARLEEVVREATDQVEALIHEEHAEALQTAGERVTAALRQYVRDVEVSLEVQPPVVRVAPPGFDLRVADDGVDTDVAHQGHGLQRALLMAMLQGLARSDEVGDVPAVMLAIEEPELYQHPVQARHFAAVLGELPRRGEGAFQVAYATHSAFFVDPRRYERLRRFTRRRPGGTRVVSVATRAGVAARLAGIVPPEQVDQRISMTLERTLAEAVFADAALLVEGRSDAALLNGLADRDGGLARLGVAVVNTNGKSTLPLAWAILKELEVPTYVVFDADRGVGDRLRADGRADRADAEEVNVANWNRRLTRLFAGAEAEWPDVTVAEGYACFEVDLESAWPDAVANATALRDAADDWRAKPDDWYAEAARDEAVAVPDAFAQIIERVRALP